jgi:hypothetical protein
LAHLCHAPDYIANLVEYTEKLIQQQGDQILNLQATIIRMERERQRLANEQKESGG